MQLHCDSDNQGDHNNQGEHSFWSKKFKGFSKTLKDPCNFFFTNLLRQMCDETVSHFKCRNCKKAKL